MKLSRRQRQVLRELLAGCCYESIGARLGITPGTARLHCVAVYQRFSVNSRAQLMAKCMQPTDEARRLIGDA